MRLGWTDTWERVEWSGPMHGEEKMRKKNLRCVRRPMCGEGKKKWKKESRDRGGRCQWRGRFKAQDLNTCTQYHSADAVISHSFFSHGGRQGPTPVFSFLSIFIHAIATFSRCIYCKGSGRKRPVCIAGSR